MNCPKCQAETKQEGQVCQSCGAPLNSRAAGKAARNRKRDPQGPVSAETEARHQAALRAFRVSVAGLIPGLGLILGPTAMLLGDLSRRQALKDPEFYLWGPAYGAIAFGAVITLCNWLGVTLMFLGLWSAGLL